MVATPERSTYWIPHLYLAQEDRQDLAGGGWLSSTHMAAVNTLFKQHYPGKNGLQDTAVLSQHLNWESSNSNFVQILYVTQNHWVCASNVLSTPDIVEVFDSLPATFSSTLTTKVAAMLHSSKSKFILRYIEVQHQNGADDCGLFAIAFAKALCAGKDLHLLSFDQKKMRQHLQSNLEGGTITGFPSAAKPQRSQRRRVKISRYIQIYCHCRLPWSLQSYKKFGNLIQCSQCKEWYHQYCQLVYI